MDHGFGAVLKCAPGVLPPQTVSDCLTEAPLTCAHLGFLASMALSLQLCRFSTFSDRCLPETFARIGVFRCRKPLSVRCSGESESSSSSSVAVDSDFDAKAFRHNLTRSKNYNRRGFGHKDETLELMNREYTSEFCKNWLLNFALFASGFLFYFIFVIGFSFCLCLVEEKSRGKEIQALCCLVH